MTPENQRENPWTVSNGNEVPEGQLIEVEVEHFNKSLGLKNEFGKGRFGSDGFYFEEGGELAYNWNIIRWRKL